MVKVGYYLQRVNKDGLASIQAKFTIKLGSFNSMRVNYNTGLRAPAKIWDKRKQRVKETLKTINWHFVNDELNTLQTIISQVYREYLVERKLSELTTTKYKAELDARYKGFERISHKGFLSYASYYLEFVYKTKPDYSKHALEIHKRTLKYLAELYPSLSFADLTNETFRQFALHLRQRKLSDNYISRLLSSLFKICALVEAEGMKLPNDYKTATPRKLGFSRTRGFKISLTVNEVYRFYTWDYVNDKHRRVVDIFCANCFTGLRYSNWKDVNQDNIITIDGHQLVDVQTVKGGPRVVFPIHPIVKEVIEKYNGYPPVISEQKLRQYLKEAGKQAGFTTMVNKSIIRNGKQVERVPRYTLITTHVARNSFNSNALDAGIPDRDIKKFMGHSTRDMTDIYDRRTPERIALKYVGHDFFNYT